MPPQPLSAGIAKVGGAMRGGLPRILPESGEIGPRPAPAEPGFTGGVTVAAGGFGVLVGQGPGGPPEVRLFRLQAETGAIGPFTGLVSSLVFNPVFTGGVFVACDSHHNECDGGPAVGAGAGGGPHVRIFDQIGFVEREFFAYDVAFPGGVRVALGDFDGDGADETVTAPGPGGGPHVRILKDASRGTLTSFAEFLAYDAGFTGRVTVAVGDVDGDSFPEIITGAGPGGGPHVRIFKVDPVTHAVTSLGPGFFAYAPGFTGGVYIGVANVDGTGAAEIITGAGPGGGPHVRVWKVTPGSGAVTEFGTGGFFAFDLGFIGGATVAGGFFR